jgi:hypothetical protein
MVERDSTWGGIDHLKRCQPVSVEASRARVSEINYGPSSLRCQAQARTFLLTISKKVHLPTQMGRGPVCRWTAELRGGGVASGFDDVGELEYGAGRPMVRLRFAMRLIVPGRRPLKQAGRTMGVGSPCLVGVTVERYRFGLASGVGEVTKPSVRV